MNRSIVHVLALALFLLISVQAIGQDTGLGFSGGACGSRVRADPGSTVTSSIDCVLTTSNNPGPNGVQGWSISIAGDGFLITDITTDGTVVPELMVTGFVKSETTNRSGIAGGTTVDDCAGLPGATSAVVLSFISPVTLPVNGSATIAIISTEGTAPAAGAESSGSVAYADGCRGVGQPVRNAVTLNAQTAIPSLGSCSITLAGAQAEICNNGADDDEDGDTDCADADCADAGNCSPEGNCSDGIDNDEDGNTDCDDSDCATSAACLGDVVLSFSGDNAPRTDFSGAGFSQSVECVLTSSNNETDHGAQAWSFGVTGNGLDIDGITTDGTVAENASEAGYDFSEVTTEGAIQVTILSYETFDTLPANGSSTVAVLSVSSTFPAGATETRSLSYTPGLVGSGLEVENVIAINDFDVVPATAGYEITLRGIDSNFMTMDFDSSGQFDIGDISALLYWLYRGGDAPDCRDAMDFNGNGRINIADVVSGLNHLFVHTNTVPTAGVGCQVYTECGIAGACL